MKKMKTQWIYFLIKDDGLSNNCNTAQEKISADIKKELTSEPVRNKIILNFKAKSYGQEATDFQDIKVPKVNSKCTCLAVISVDSVLKRDENYYLQMFLKECKYIKKSGQTYY